MNKTKKYLYDRFSETKWPYFSLKVTMEYIGVDCIEELSLLKEQGMVENAKGFKGPLIKLINWESKWNQN